MSEPFTLLPLEEMGGASSSAPFSDDLFPFYPFNDDWPDVSLLDEQPLDLLPPLGENLLLQQQQPQPPAADFFTQQALAGAHGAEAPAEGPGLVHWAVLKFLGGSL